MTGFLRTLGVYHWIAAAVGLVLVGWVGVSLLSTNPSRPVAGGAGSDRPASIVMDVSGMYCASCKRNVERALGGLDGVEEVAVNLEQEQAKIWTAENADLEDQILEKTVTEAGYEPGTIRRPRGE